MAQVNNREQVEIIERIPWGDPPSPWLRRYGGTVDPTLRREGRSGLAPKFPTLQPFGIDDVDYKAPPLDRPPGAELDSLLWDEATQLYENKGWKSWQVGAFVEGLPWPDDTINVVEAEWHPLFRKERWYDLQVPLEPGDPDKGIMSIDNPLVWEDMSVVIELASRLFKQLVGDGFFDTFLSDAPFSEVQTVSVSDEFTNATNSNDRTPKCARRANITEPKEAHNKALERILGTAPSLVLTWYQDKSSQDNTLPLFPYKTGEREEPPFAVTSNPIGEDDKEWVQVRLAASIFRAIYQCDDTTQSGRAEKSLLMVIYALTLVHEISHAVYMSHNMAQQMPLQLAADAALDAEDEKVAQGLQTAEAATAAKDAILDSLFDGALMGSNEPAIEDDNVAELGYAAEQAMFGGVVTAMPRNGSISRSCMHTLSSTYQTQLCQFPTNAASFGSLSLHWDGESRWTFPRTDISHVVPASHAARLLSQSYWEKHCQSRGLAALRPPKVFPSAEDRTSRFQGVQNYCNVFDQDTDQANEARRLKTHFPGIRVEDDPGRRCWHTSKRLLARQTLWNKLRPWYQEEKDRWTRTPYGHYHLRLKLRSFNHAVKVQDENEAWGILTETGHMLRNLPSSRIDDKVHAYYYSVLWSMLAAVPWRPLWEEEEIEPDVEPWKLPNLWQPSTAAREWQARPGNPQFAFLSEVECEIPASSYWRGGMYPPDIKAMQPRAGRDILLNLATNTLKRLHQTGGLQESVYKSTEDQIVRLRSEINTKSCSDISFLSSFDLSLPTYELAVDKQDDTSSDLVQDLSSLVLDDPPAQPSPQGVVAQPVDSVQDSPQQDVQGGANALMARVVGQEDLTGKYWSAGEVGHHDGDDGKERWVLVDNHELGGYDVFSVSALPPRLARDVQGALQVDFEYGVHVTDHGVAARIRAMHREEREGGHVGIFRGRLLLPRGKEEIAENDGRHGHGGSKSKWVLAGPYIYDITHFSAKDDDEHEFLWSAPHGDVLGIGLTPGPHHRHLDDLQRRLYPFRCATLRRPQPTSDSTLWRPYTLREVNLHVFPQIRAFTCVDGWVYDITEFADTSPLGRQKLLGLAGREVGKHVRSSFPAEWTERFLRLVAPYKVGWIVPERSADHARLGPYEVQLGNRVYSFAVLVQNPKSKEDADLGRALSSLGGMDATDQLTPELVQLTERPGLVVAMLYSEPAFEVTQEDLDAHVGVFSAQDDYGDEDLEEEEDQGMEKYDLDGSTWARIGDVVYDVSNLVRYGDHATRARALACAGGAITDARLTHDMQRCGVAPIIGKFVGTKPGGVKRKWSKKTKTTTLSEFALELALPEEDHPARIRPGLGCGCGFTRKRLRREDMNKRFFAHRDDLPPVDPEDLAAFGYVGVDELEAKRMRLV